MASKIRDDSSSEKLLIDRGLFSCHDFAGPAVPASCAALGTLVRAELWLLTFVATPAEPFVDGGAGDARGLGGEGGPRAFDEDTTDKQRPPIDVRRLQEVAGGLPGRAYHRSRVWMKRSAFPFVRGR